MNLIGKEEAGPLNCVGWLQTTTVLTTERDKKAISDNVNKVNLFILKSSFHLNFSKLIVRISITF